MTRYADPQDMPTTIQTRVWVVEHDWLHRLFKSRQNTSPRFRLADLLSACVSLALASDALERLLVDYLVTELTLRDPLSERRSCELWPAQYELLLEAHRAPWNRPPNPMFEIDQITTGCVAMAMRRPAGESAVLRQARSNLRARCCKPTA